MTTHAARRVASRYLDPNTPVVVVSHVDPAGVPWGWADPRVPRMHLIPLSVEHAGMIWLEDGRGHRAFDAADASSNIDISTLSASVSRSRDRIEAAWVRWCLARGWLDYCPHDANVRVYGGTRYEFARRLAEEALSPRWLQVDANANSLHAPLNRLIWRGADDGSDAMASPPTTRS